MDDFIKTEATEALWKEFQEAELIRAKAVMDKLIEQYNQKGNTFDAFREIWYDQSTDKRGECHIYNLAMSCSQKRKPFTGNEFEKSIEIIHTQNNIKAYYQKWVDSSGIVYDKKPKNISVHKHDCLIPMNDESTNIEDMIVISKKTTLRERFRQDLDSIGRCKKVIFLTKEAPSKGQIDTITGYNCVIVYPHAEITEYTWSYDEYISRMKEFQNSSGDTMS